MSWIQTFPTGKAAHPLSLVPDEVDARDIAHSTGLICRFTGHVREHYSVAQHEVLAARWAMEFHGASPELALKVLCHDCFEAYGNDIARPVKRNVYLRTAGDFLPYKQVEMAALEVIYHKLGVPWPTEAEWGLIDEVDRRMVVTECRDLLRAPPLEWSIKDPPYAHTVRPWSCGNAGPIWLDEFQRLGGRL